MSAKRKKRYTAHFKFQVVMEAIKGEKSVGQLARTYNIHPISILRWKKEFMERGLSMVIEFLPILVIENLPTL